MLRSALALTDFYGEHPVAEEKMFESEFDYTLERENMEKVRTNVQKRWGDRRVLGYWTEPGHDWMPTRHAWVVLREQK